MSASERMTCMYCLRESTVRLALDRKSRPWLRCGMCGTKTFIYEAEALRGLILMEPAARDFVRRLGAGDLAEAQREGQAVVDDLAEAAA